jgi:hypothetical protein
LIDDNSNNYLKLSSGAALTFKDFMPFKQEPKTTGMTIELDFEVNGTLNYNTDLISCFSTNKDLEVKSGFKITGDTISFYGSNGTLLSLKYVEGKRIKVSFVIEKSTTNYPMAYVYLNGKLSGAAFYKTASFEDNEYPAKLKVDSTAAQIKLYSVRFYSSSLNDKTILNNYTASLSVLEDRQASYDTNNVYKGNSDEIDFIKVNSEEYSSRIPYMILTGGYATEAESKWKRKDNTGDIIGRLPTGKKDYRMVDVEVKYPKNEDFSGYVDYKFKNEFASGKPIATAYGETPTNGGAIMYAQGTSSMEYPVKNLRLRFKGAKNWYTVRPDIAPVEIICMKADYMESSGSHNTGAANFIDALYNGAGIATPGQEHFGGADKKTIVTCIKGHPCLIFYSDTGEPGSYNYVGKYNLNLDKATPEPFGFDHDDSDFGYLEPGDEYYEIEYDDEDKYIDTKEGEDLKHVAEGEKVNAIHCFEFLDNAVEVCNFLGK